jgi:inhibitor of cysteine peptidase
MRRIKYLLAGFLLATQITHAAAPVQYNNIYTENNTAIGVSASQPEFIIKLKSNPTTGYSWFLRDYNSALVESISHEFQAPTDKKLMGAPGYELWKFKVKPAAFTVPQQTTIKLVYARPWESGESSTQQIFKITTIVK